MDKNNESVQPAETRLVVLLKENNISEEMAVAISPAFSELFQQATEWNNKATEFLSNPDLLPEDKAKEARIARLALVKVRTGIDKERKKLNDGDQKRIDDRNLAGKVLTGLIVPTEKILLEEEEKQEKIEKEKKQAVKNQRLEKLAPYNVDSTFFDLENMPEEAFEVLLDNSRLAFEKKAEDEKKLQEKDSYAKMILSRVQNLIELGFRRSDSEGKYSLEIQSYIGDSCCCFDVLPDDFDKSEIIWNEFFNNIKQQINYYNEKIAADKKASEDKLKAEKEKAERETDLLKQQQKEKAEKHQVTIERQKKLAEIKVIEDYQKLYDMDEGSFNDYFIDKNSQYQAEENKKFVEQKRLEFDAKILSDKIDARKKILAEIGFVFDGVNNYTHRDVPGVINEYELKLGHIDSVLMKLAFDIKKIQADIKVKREAELAPDKEKLKVAVSQISFICDVKEHEASLTLAEIFNRVNSLKKWAYEQINLLK